jgi:hypothetical protein
VLKPGGLLIIDAPNIAGIDSDTIVDEWFIDQRLYHFSRVTLARLLESCGFDIVAGPDPKDRENLLFAARKRGAPARAVQRDPGEVDAALALITSYVPGAPSPGAPLKDPSCRPRLRSRHHDPCLSRRAPALRPSRILHFRCFIQSRLFSIEEVSAHRHRTLLLALLALAATHGRSGSGRRLHAGRNRARDPAWVRRFAICSGRTGRTDRLGMRSSSGLWSRRSWWRKQFRLGNDIYRRCWVFPTVALCQRTDLFRRSVAHYLDAGYEALPMDWDNPAAHHPNGGRGPLSPQRAWAPTAGRSVSMDQHGGVCSCNAAHGEFALDDYLDFVAAAGAIPRVLWLYASDGEIFDFRPGRYRTEEPTERANGTFGRGVLRAVLAAGMRLATLSMWMRNTDPNAEPCRRPSIRTGQAAQYTTR